MTVQVRVETDLRRAIALKTFKMSSYSVVGHPAAAAVSYDGLVATARSDQINQHAVVVDFMAANGGGEATKVPVPGAHSV